MSCGVGCGFCGFGSDLSLLWLWHRPPAVAPIRPLAWELAYAMDAALKKTKKNAGEKLHRSYTPENNSQSCRQYPWLALNELKLTVFTFLDFFKVDKNLL